MKTRQMYVYTTLRHIQTKRVGVIHTTACGMELFAMPSRNSAMFDCPRCFKETS